ncbi:hypothetical protein C2845_PM17G05420 [Panicum miliaceum]|uniref:KIB1-4 beta-propeller domain-containing protein n=1 Tax=Panicum miliaceum TaxID=4540 RepID=A0A3L6Q4F6_PANMI|nr:hypothetical protein C2845_PM17G05420 [Panicum miliaceum]
MAAAPPPAPCSWADLAADHLYEVLARVPCPVDRHRARLVCRAWRAAAAFDPPAKPPPLPRALPWLLLPAPYLDPDGATRAVCCVLSGCRVHHHLAVTPPRARCFGSHNGAWLFLHFRDTASHLLVNVRTGVVHHCLPGVLGNKLVALAAALSSLPREGDARCVAAAIVANVEAPRQPSVLLWRVGAQRLRGAVQVQQSIAVGVGLGVDVEDVVYHRRAFHLLTSGGHIIVCKPTVLQNGDLGADQELRFFLPSGRSDDQFVRARYLVVSRGELLMVVRFTPQPNQPTSEFMVFRVIEQQNSGDKAHTDVDDAAADADADNAEDGGNNFVVQNRWSSWSELDTLGGRMLFVGHGCSRSYEVDQYPGFKHGIYFLDDGEFYDAAVIFGNGNERRYPCSDNGKWSEGQIQRCFPRSDPSDHSAPVWLLP